MAEKQKKAGSMKHGRKKIPLLWVLLLIGIVPLAVAVLSCNIASVKTLKSSIRQDTYEKLESAAQGLAAYYEDDVINGTVLNNHDYVDSLLAQNVELTLFVKDTRCISSLYTSEGRRNEGTKADPEIYSIVCGGQPYFDSGVKIGEDTYYVCYLPIQDRSGKVVGMAFAGEKEDGIKAHVASAIVSLTAMAIVIALIFGAIVVLIAMAIGKELAKVVDATEELAKGNLNTDFEINSTVKEVETLAQAAGDLKENIGKVISMVASKAGNLDNSMGRIAEGVSTSNQATEGIVLAVDEMAKGSQEMAESVQNTAVKMQEIGEGISAITSLAKSAENSADEVQRESREAKEQLSNLIKANGRTIQISNDVVSGINESAGAVENIRKAAEVISEIASQTALLSLNASIEAARAGDAGRGFAVVAGEISSLANQSDASSQEIQKVVEEIISYSQRNVKLAGDIKAAIDNEGSVLGRVNRSFEVVDKKVQSTAQSVGEITVHAGRLDVAKEGVLDEVSALSAISEQNAASCQETNAAMEELGVTVETINQETQDTRGASTELREAVAFFKL